MKVFPPRLSSMLRYLRFVGPPHKWRVCLANCPLCGKTLFLAFQKDPFLTRCLTCRSNVTNLSLIPLIERHFSGIYSGRSAYELSTYGSTLTWLRRNFPVVITSEFFPDKRLGENVNGILNQDVQRLTFGDGSFDLVTSNQVFEHVPDDVTGFEECHRILKNGGAMILSVPLYNLPETVRIAKLVGTSVEFIGKPEFHDSRLGGAQSAPVFWHHAISDIAARVKSAGFSKVTLEKVLILTGQGSPANIVYAIK